MQYSLKKTFLKKENPKTPGYLTEGFWDAMKDLAITAAEGGPDAVKAAVSKKLSAALKSGADMPAKNALSLVQHLKAQGLDKAWGEDLDTMEKELTKRIKSPEKNDDVIDQGKLRKLLGIGESVAGSPSAPYAKQTLAEIFLK